MRLSVFSCIQHLRLSFALPRIKPRPRRFFGSSIHFRRSIAHQDAYYYICYIWPCPASRQRLAARPPPSALPHQHLRRVLLLCLYHLHLPCSAGLPDHIFTSRSRREVLIRSSPMRARVHQKGLPAIAHQSSRSRLDSVVPGHSPSFGLPQLTTTLAALWIEPCIALFGLTH